MPNPVQEMGRELVAFAQAALVRPVPSNYRESASAVRRRRWVAGATLIVGAGVLGLALRIPPGSDWFYLATAALALVWSVGGVLSGPLHLGYAHTRSGARLARPVVQGLALATAINVLFLAGAFVVARIPVLRDPADQLLDHARLGELWLVAVITVANGIAEELYFRGACYAAAGRRSPVAVTTGLYTLTTIATGNPMLVFAAAVLGLITGLQRRVTGGVLAPMITHVAWSLTMLLVLPPMLDSLR